MHCRVGTDGEAFHPNLDPQPFDAIFLKGEHAAAYSGFEGRTTDGEALADWLRGRGVEQVDICGIATDYCVRATALDARIEGFETRRAHRDVRRGRARVQRSSPRRDAGGRRHSGLRALSGPSTRGAIAWATDTSPVIGRIITRNSSTNPDSSSETKSAPSISRPSDGRR